MCTFHDTLKGWSCRAGFYFSSKHSHKSWGTRFFLPWHTLWLGLCFYNKVVILGTHWKWAPKHQNLSSAPDHKIGAQSVPRPSWCWPDRDVDFERGYSNFPFGQAPACSGSCWRPEWMPEVLLRNQTRAGDFFFSDITFLSDELINKCVPFLSCSILLQARSHTALLSFDCHEWT